MYQKLKVKKQERVAEGVWSLVLHAPEMAKESKPGQFVMLKAWEGNEPFLMRPISINSANAETGELCFLYKLVGRGTHLMTELKPGDEVICLGPLGHGFVIPENAKRIALIGRGIGIAPLRFLAEEAHRRGVEVIAYLSGKNEERLFDKNIYSALGFTVRSTTDPDVKVTDFFAEDLKTMRFDAAYSCGSKRLAKAMKELHDAYGFPAYVSLEEHMACGIGACKGCICTEYEKETGESHYARVCKSGPVFDVERVIK